MPVIGTFSTSVFFSRDFFFSWFFFSLRENFRSTRENPNLHVSMYIKNCPWNSKYFLKFSRTSRTWKLKEAYVKKPLIFDFNILLKSLLLYVKYRKSSKFWLYSRLVGILDLFKFVKIRNYVKIFKNINFPYEKIKFHTWINPKTCLWYFGLPVKNCRKVCVKAIFLCVKKNQN